MNSLKLTAGIALASLSLFSASAATAQKLTVAHGFSPTHFLSTHVVEPWMQCMGDATAQGLTFDYYPSGQITAANVSLDALNNGLTQLSTVSVGYVSNKMPLNGLSMLPDMGDNSVEMLRAYRAMLEQNEAFRREHADNRIRPLVVNMLPVYQLVSKGAPIDTPEKLRGSIIRSSGGAMNLALTAVGAAPTEMPAGDLYIAIERGTVDGALSALSSIKPYSLQELLKSVSSNGKFGSFATLFAIDTGTWDKLSPEHQAAAEACGQKIETELALHQDAENESLKAEFAAMGITVYEFSDAANATIAEALTNVADEYVGRLEARKLPARATYDAYRAVLAR